MVVDDYLDEFNEEKQGRVVVDATVVIYVFEVDDEGA